MCVDQRAVEGRVFVAAPSWQLWHLLGKFGIDARSPELLETVIKAHWTELAKLAHAVHEG